MQNVVGKQGAVWQCSKLTVVHSSKTSKISQQLSRIKKRKDEENANTGDSQPTRVKKAKKDRDFKPAWKRILHGL